MLTSRGTEQASSGVRIAIGRPRKLSREDIVGGAITLIEKKGPKALTLRALGKLLDVQPSTIYNYFPSVSHLNQEIGRTLLSSVPLPGTLPEMDARTQLLEHFIALREALVRHPGVLDYVPGSNSWIWSLQKLEAELALLNEAGISPETSIMLVRVLDVLCQSSAMVTRQWNASETTTQRKRLLTGINPVQIPHVMANLELIISQLPGPQGFRETAEAVIDSLAPQLRTRRSRK